MRTTQWLLVIACAMTATAVAQQPPVEASATVKQLHETMIKPASEVIFNVGREAPMSDEQWAALASAGVTLVKSGDLLMLVSPPNRTRWVTLSRQLGAAGRTVRRAADARRLGALMRTPDRLILVCETCHASYRNQATQAGGR